MTSKSILSVKFFYTIIEFIYKLYYSGECKWSAEPQSVFEGKHMKQLVKEALEKKVVWPWVEPDDDDADQRKTILKSKGFKEWKNAKAKSKANKWIMRYAIDPKTGKFVNKIYTIQ